MKYFDKVSAHNVFDGDILYFLAESQLNDFEITSTKGGVRLFGVLCISSFEELTSLLEVIGVSWEQSSRMLEGKDLITDEEWLSRVESGVAALSSAENQDGETPGTKLDFHKAKLIRDLAAKVKDTGIDNMNDLLSILSAHYEVSPGHLRKVINGEYWADDE